MRISNLKKNKEVPKLLSIIVDQFFMSITTFLTTIVLARTYAKAGYADLVLLFSITIFVLGFQSAIISKPYAINLNDFKGERHSIYYHFNLHLKFYFTVLVLLIFPLVFIYLFETWDSNKLIMYTVYIISNISYFFIRETLLSERKTKQNLFYGLSCSLGLLILLGFVFFKGNIGISTYLSIASLIYSILTLTYLFKHFKKNSFVKNQYRNLIKINWQVGKWLLGSNVFFFLSSSIYPWLLLYITNKDDIAVYSVLISVSSVVNPLLSALSSYILPLFVSKNSNYKSINTMVKKWTLFFGILSVILIVVGYFLGQEIINLLFGEKYMNLGFLVFYPFFIQAINVLFQPVRISLNAVKRTDINFWVLIPRSIVAIVLGYYLISMYGLAGAFYTMVIENTMYQILNFIMYRNIINKGVLNRDALV